MNKLSLEDVQRMLNAAKMEPVASQSSFVWQEGGAYHLSYTEAAVQEGKSATEIRDLQNLMVVMRQSPPKKAPAKPQSAPVLSADSSHRQTATVFNGNNMATSLSLPAGRRRMQAAMEVLSAKYPPTDASSLDALENDMKGALRGGKKKVATPCEVKAETPIHTETPSQEGMGASLISFVKAMVSKGKEKERSFVENILSPATDTGRSK
jgi:hypothetical protein